MASTARTLSLASSRHITGSPTSSVRALPPQVTPHANATSTCARDVPSSPVSGQARITFQLLLLGSQCSVAFLWFLPPASRAALHRLDRLVSGLLLLATSAEAAEVFRQQVGWQRNEQLWSRGFQALSGCCMDVASCAAVSRNWRGVDLSPICGMEASSLASCCCGGVRYESFFIRVLRCGFSCVPLCCSITVS